MKPRAKTPRRKEKRLVMTENEIGKIVVDAAIAVHRALGPGLLETVKLSLLTNYREEDSM